MVANQIVDHLVRDYPVEELLEVPQEAIDEFVLSYEV